MNKKYRPIVGEMFDETMRIIKFYEKLTPQDEGYLEPHEVKELIKDRLVEMYRNSLN